MHVGESPHRMFYVGESPHRMFYFIILRPVGLLITSIKLFQDFFLFFFMLD
jgi:hypothetical protein